ncbi:Antitoxin Phd_YefM, type II toxin-antitoxin system [Marinomonas polaris DSM 16579]|uniref:Antitoxin n=1 Tax=Marinomonas polaris DSM 16579 TaxID=1122206 RepID=A0A1M5HAP0_9GAMM|nr:type II toxin-antitoxin system Phd/YefM family antitoxin [Marinomonas polaris]SHG12822.1 Antitoxin Phd_YefM, type II toxin-antitoxin system [Marinomonas polaris DSM 16579]|tara:strand:+ start:3608 stop:3739 length:132 start_codon:yes stop_codon:yes gene_type:complete
MDAISFTAAKANLADIMDKVCNDHAPAIIMSLEDYNAMQEIAS